MRLQSAALGERHMGELGDFAAALTHVDESRRIRLRRGNMGEQGVTALLDNTTATLAEGDDNDASLLDRRGDVDIDMAASRRATVLEDCVEASDATEAVVSRTCTGEQDEERCVSVLKTPSFGSRSALLKWEALGVSASSSSSKQERSEALSAQLCAPNVLLFERRFNSEEQMVAGTNETAGGF